MLSSGHIYAIIICSTLIIIVIIALIGQAIGKGPQ